MEASVSTSGGLKHKVFAKILFSVGLFVRYMGLMKMQYKTFLADLAIRSLPLERYWSSLEAL